MSKKIFNLENTYINLPNIFYTKQNPSCVPKPELVILNDSLADELGMEVNLLKDGDAIEVLSGNKVIDGTTPISQAYAGHQFGYFNMLGDGRAILLGEYVTKNGERIDIQLKGAGKTLYSRGGDGKAALGPMLREYIISEAMHGLDIPTTRSLAVVTTGEKIIREKILEGAILTRIASSHIRVGTFQYAARYGSIEELKILADYTIKRHFKEVDDNENKYLALLKSVVEKQANLIAKWQLVGFIHGVMNTDNMTISGETIDYGPCAFMDTYNPETVFSSIDTNGRYAYGNQPNIAVWNLARFAESLIPILSEDKDKAIMLAKNAISDFSNIYMEKWMSGMRRKLGLFNEKPEDKYIIEGILSIMNKYGADYTNTFRVLTLDSIDELEMSGIDEFDKWLNIWRERLKKQEQSMKEAKELMKKSNPAVIPRNHRVEEALEKAVNNHDYSLMERLLEVLKNPYEYSKSQEEYAIVNNKCKTPYRTFCGT